MRTYPNAAKGLSKMFWAKILYIIGVVIAAFFSTVVAIVALVIYLVGLYQTQADDPGFNTAFFLAIIQLVMEFFGVFLGSLGDIISMVLNLAVLYLDRLVIYTRDLQEYSVLSGTEFARYVSMRSDGSALLLSSSQAWLYLP